MYIVIFVTASNKKEAQNIASKLVRARLVACVNILDRCESIFWWQGKVDRSIEALLIIKTKKTKLAGVIKLVKSLHSYDCPEIIALPIVAGNAPYLRWIDESVGKPG